MPGDLLIRIAWHADAAAMLEIRRASIRDLCSADHHNDAQAIAAWIGPVDKFDRLFEQPHVTLIVAEIAGTPVGLGGMQGDTITLNYVHPAYRFCGISKALMADLEARLAQAGVDIGRLGSTATALGFYRSIGWSLIGDQDADGAFPMIKRL